MSALNASERRACWGARDELWKCLDANQDSTSACEKYQQNFEAKCPAQWVKYFIKRRDFLKYKEKIQNEGYKPTEGEPKL
ncbi:cytochrome c oxidase assembly factor 6 homolog [Xyrauchen texanus]|uniref:cytochrome c oxidase assembly factor 6 homolog n=1 Tax=Xyrauchen texanus TaxID=154827 RepID=UPI00224260B6|nr:cytochrome c oxidase assembly factor 6 homolog [Xyrauchen texanus]